MAGHFRLQRVKKIMKSSSEVENISKDSIVVVTHAAELFLSVLLKEAHKDSKKAKKLEYRNIANIVNDHERYEFLREMIPHKIKVHEYYEIMKKKFCNEIELNDNDNSDRRSSSSSSSSDSESDDSKEKQSENISDSGVMVID